MARIAEDFSKSVNVSSPDSIELKSAALPGMQTLGKAGVAVGAGWGAMALTGGIMSGAVTWAGIQSSLAAFGGMAAAAAVATTPLAVGVAGGIAALVALRYLSQGASRIGSVLKGLFMHFIGDPLKRWNSEQRNLLLSGLDEDVRSKVGHLDRHALYKFTQIQKGIRDEVETLLENKFPDSLNLDASVQRKVVERCAQRTHGLILEVAEHAGRHGVYSDRINRIISKGITNLESEFDGILSQGTTNASPQTATPPPPPKTGTQAPTGETTPVPEQPTGKAPPVEPPTSSAVPGSTVVPEITAEIEAHKSQLEEEIRPEIGLIRSKATSAEAKRAGESYISKIEEVIAPLYATASRIRKPELRGNLLQRIFDIVNNSVNDVAARIDAPEPTVDFETSAANLQTAAIEVWKAHDPENRRFRGDSNYVRAGLASRELALFHGKQLGTSGATILEAFDRINATLNGYDQKVRNSIGSSDRAYQRGLELGGAIREARRATMESLASTFEQLTSHLRPIVADSLTHAQIVPVRNARDEIKKMVQGVMRLGESVADLERKAQVAAA